MMIPQTFKLHMLEKKWRILVNSAQLHWLPINQVPNCQLTGAKILHAFHHLKNVSKARRNLRSTLNIFLLGRFCRFEDLSIFGDVLEKQQFWSRILVQPQAPAKKRQREGSTTKAIGELRLRAWGHKLRNSFAPCKNERNICRKLWCFPVY